MIKHSFAFEKIWKIILKYQDTENESDDFLSTDKIHRGVTTETCLCFLISSYYSTDGLSPKRGHSVATHCLIYAGVDTDSTMTNTTLDCAKTKWKAMTAPSDKEGPFLSNIISTGFKNNMQKHSKKENNK